MRRRAILVMLVVAALWALPATPLEALSVPHPPKPQQLTVSGFVVGRIAKGNLVRFGVLASDPRSWGDLHSVKVVLLLHGQRLQEMSFFVKEGTFKLGDRPTVSTLSCHGSRRSDQRVPSLLESNPASVGVGSR